MVALSQIRPQLLLSGQYFVAAREGKGWRERGSVSNTPPAAQVSTMYRPASFLCRGARARGQRERGSVSNTPPAALVRSVLCSGPPTLSAEVRGQGGRGSAALCQICPKLFLPGQYFVGAPTPYAEMIAQGGGGRVALCQIRLALLLSGQYCVQLACLLPLRAKGCGSVSNTATLVSALP